MEGERLPPLLHVTSANSSVTHEAVVSYGSTELILKTSDEPKSCCLSPSVCSLLTQFWACFGKYLCMLNIGLLASITALVMPLAASGKFYINMTNDDIQDFVTVLFFTMPIGSVLSVLPLNTTRKPPIILSQAVMAASWVGTYVSTKPWHLILSRAFGGVALTLSQPHVAAYVGEVTTPGLRGIFGGFTQTMGIAGQLIMSGLTFLDNWDSVIIICMTFAIISMIYLTTIPESPILLLSMGQDNKAFYSLRKLRGWKWFNETETKKEFAELVKHYGKKNSKPSITPEANTGVENTGFEADETEDNPNEKNINDKSRDSNNFIINFESSIEENFHPSIIPLELSEHFSKFEVLNTAELGQGRKEKGPSKLLIEEEKLSFWRYMMLPIMYKPMVIMAVASIFITGPGSSGISTYLHYVLDGYHIADHYSAILTGLTGAMLGGNLLSAGLVAKLGKKPLILLSTTGAALGYLALIGLLHLPTDASTSPWLVGSVLAWTIFMEELGLRTIYHALFSELFPMRGKKIGMGLVVSLISLTGIITGQTFLGLIAAYGVASIMVMNLSICVFGSVFYYFVFIETEGKTLKEIEDGFRGNKERIPA